MGKQELRVVASVLLLTIGCLALTAAIAATWVDAVLLDTDTFVAALAPLARDEGVRETTSERISAAIVEHADFRALADEILPEALRPLGERLAEEFERFVRSAVGELVYSEVFADVWLESVRIWHGSFRDAVTGQGDAYLEFEGGRMRVALAPYLEAIEARIENPLLQSVSGLVLDRLRETRVTLVESWLLQRQVEVMNRLYAMRVLLWWLAGGGLLGGVALAPKRSVAVTGAGLGVALAAAVPLVWLATQRWNAERVLGSLTGATRDVSRAAYDTLTTPLLHWLLAAGGAGLAAAAVGWAAWRLRSRLPGRSG